MKQRFTARRGGALKRKSQNDPAGDAFGYVESVINECTRALPLIEAGRYDAVVINLERALTFLQKGLDILEYIGE